MDLESGDMPLDARLEDMGIDVEEFKTYVCSP
jgi:small subunit ribosomal protein S10